ncbi:MAG TPA: TIGR03621 family F420-dependent LLM class oxidoreductase [Acidimicrobiales bacterium]|nr:TIGR03621 family F420-dependent LLM class oxidoreductase [Acidimicrobiales bacterium]
MKAKPFRFGVQVSGAGDGAAWAEQARRIEGLGYSTLWVPDHFDAQWGPLVALTAAAMATTTLLVGPLVLDNDYRHPAVVAKEMATLDVVSGGRVEVGIGAGWMRQDYLQNGLKFDPPGVRIQRLAEAVAVVKALWSEPCRAVDFKGIHYSLDGAVGRPRPVQQPRPLLLMAGGGRRMLSLAAREADIVGFNANLAAGEVGPEVARQAVAERFRERVAWVREAAGDRFDDLELHCHTFMCMVGADRRQVAEIMAGPFGVSPGEALEVPIALVGTVDELCDTLLKRREELGFSYWAIPANAFEAFAPVVARLAGT